VARVSASYGYRRVTKETVEQKPLLDYGPLVREIDTLESIALGFQAEMFTISDDAGKQIGSAVSGAGFGGYFMTVEWRDRKVCVSAVDVLHELIRRHYPDDVEYIPVTEL
jgi:hypothetical protein